MNVSGRFIHTVAWLVFLSIHCSGQIPSAPESQRSSDNLDTKIKTNSIGMKFKLIPAGTFKMGSDEDYHQVTLTRPFYLGIYEVTQEQYSRVMGNHSSRFKGPQNPVDYLSWEDAEGFCRNLSELPDEKAAGREYRLPTEAEWEYACRAGKTTKYSFGDNPAKLAEYVWYKENSSSTTHPVGEKKPNPWGLYDMQGNVLEWCSDLHGDYPKGAVSDPVGASRGLNRVLRGGSWDYDAARCDSAYRFPNPSTFKGSDFGIRVALSFREISK